jgi:hypothetical protein
MDIVNQTKHAPKPFPLPRICRVNQTIKTKNLPYYRFLNYSKTGCVVTNEQRNKNSSPKQRKLFWLRTF